MAIKRLANKTIGAVVPILVIAALCSAAGTDDRITIWGTPPREKPHRTKAAEGFPPLPLPVVPQRRTEKKRPPAPPKLLANLANFSFDGWQGSPGAVDTLLTTAQENLKVWYGWEQLDVATLVREQTSGVTHRTPIIYLCAYYPLDLSDEQRAALAAYVLAGGTLIINCCGQDDAFASAQAELARMFPKFELRLLPPDHPIYHSYDDIEKVSYPAPSTSALDQGAATIGPPRLRAITLGTRAAVMVSHEDLACGWNRWNNPTVKRVGAKDSDRIGLNLITYITAENRFAKFLSKTQEVAGPSIRPREQLVFAQIIHDGNWNPNPSAVPLFLKELASNTSVAVQFDRQTIQLKDPSLFNLPMLYMTGTWDPRLSDQEVALLHRYLCNGGVLIADAASGRGEFDAAFRALCRRMFPDQPLEVLPADHPLFSAFHKIDMLRLNHQDDPIAPVVEAVTIDGRPAILYSRFGLSDGWAHEFSAYARGYVTPDALKLGMNLVVYAMQ
jgi:hypothetical protein